MRQEPPTMNPASPSEEPPEPLHGLAGALEAFGRLLGWSAFLWSLAPLVGVASWVALLTTYGWCLTDNDGLRASCHGPIVTALAVPTHVLLFGSAVLLAIGAQSVVETRERRYQGPRLDGRMAEIRERYSAGTLSRSDADALIGGIHALRGRSLKPARQLRLARTLGLLTPALLMVWMLAALGSVIFAVQVGSNGLADFAPIVAFGFYPSYSLWLPALALLAAALFSAAGRRFRKAAQADLERLEEEAHRRELDAIRPNRPKPAAKGQSRRPRHDEPN